MMFPLVLSLFDAGLMLTIVILLVLYLIVLIKLKPSTGGKKILKKDLSKQKIPETASTERRGKPVERPERVPPPLPTKTEKAEFSKEARNSACPYHFGYLREHPKNTPIPNECLTCIKIMECLSRVE